MNAASYLPALIGLVVAAGGWIVGRRKTKADTADMITAAAGKVVTQVTADYARLAADLDRVRTALAEAQSQAAEALRRAEDAEHRASVAEQSAARLRTEADTRGRTIAAQADEIRSLQAQLAALRGQVEASNGHTGELPVIPPSAT